MNNWIETSGSPFVIVEQQYAHQWKGQENYNAICSVTDYLGKIYIDNHVLLVMGDEPMATRIVNKDGAIFNNSLEVCSRLSNGGKTSGE